MSDWEIKVWSSPDHEDLVVEVYHADQLVGLIDQEEGAEDLRVTFSSEPGRLSLRELEEALARAKTRLHELRRKS